MLFLMNHGFCHILADLGFVWVETDAFLAEPLFIFGLPFVSDVHHKHN